MSEKATPHPFYASPDKKLESIQYLFDVTRNAHAAASVHDKCRTYAQFLADSLVEPKPVQKTASQLAPADLAEAVTEAQSAPSEPVAPTGG